MTSLLHRMLPIPVRVIPATRGSLAMAVLLAAFCPSLATAGEAEHAEFFENQVRPLLVEKCQSCHGATKQQASLRLDTRSGLMVGGENGPAIVAGQVDVSLLIQAVRREGLEMPPDEPLTENEVGILERWVREGGYWPAESASGDQAIALGDQEAILKKASEHWAFRPIRKPEVPQVKHPSAVRNPIDAFIIQKLEERGLQPAPAADPRSLLRRAAFDVTGLPPTAKEIDDFTHDESPSAFQNVIDRLLASKQFGQRWGRYWLDIARYADTRDWQAQTDPRYPFAYSYRDYVIRSLNDDKPYDQFLREQLAADMITNDPHAPELSALGFHTVGPRFRNNDLEQIADRMDAVTRGMMGLTVACARCHDHKYDPVTIEDYYALYGVFDSTRLTDEYPTLNGTRKISKELVAEYEKARQEKVQAMEDYILGLRRDGIEAVCKEPEKYFACYYETGLTKALEARGAITKYKVEDVANAGFDDAMNRVLRNAANVRHPVLGPLVVGLKLSDDAFKQQADQFVTEQGEPSRKRHPWVIQALKDAQPKSRLELLQVYASLLARAVAKDAPENEESEELKEAFLGQEGILDFQRSAVITGHRLLGGGRKKLGDLESAIREVDATHPGSPPRAMIIAEKEKPVTPFVMLRGEPSRRGEQVPRRFISFLDQGKGEEFQQGSGRLELANKIASADNPLTARVAVNRVWARYFGRGLVRSVDDFGLRCDPPSHPELLDWLAASFIENGWSLKWLHRTILESATYQRTSLASSSNPAHQIDPENDLLWRQNRRRLDFEATRDTMLAVSGELDRSLDGPSVKLSQTPFPVRRTVYAYVDRVDLDPMLKIFDFASPLTSAAQRAETIVPQHALFVMNHPFVIDRARAIAGKVRPEQATAEAEARGVNGLYRRMLGRMPEPQERSAALKFLREPVATDDAKRPSSWSYGVGMRAEDGSYAFKELPHWTGQHYQWSDVYPNPDYGFVRLSATGGHPGNARLDAVRRFHVEEPGSIKIEGKLEHLRDRGDGIIGKILYTAPDGRTTLLGEWTAFNDEKQTTVDTVAIEKGGYLDFVISAGKTPSSDAFNWTHEIAMNHFGEMKTWSSKEGFKPPATPPMDQWEQLAQALMLTNEFVYID